jgi:serine protease
MKSLLTLSFALLACVPSVSARPAGNRTGRFIVILKAQPPPPRLLRIEEHLEGVAARRAGGGKRSPYLLVKPKKPHQFTLPSQLRTLVEHVEPEIFMYSQPLTALQARVVRVPRPRIGSPASGSREEVPQATQTPPPISTPNDPHFSYQWGLLDTGFGVKLPTARRWGRGAGVTVGIVDSGVRQDLADLKGVTFLPPYNALTQRPGGTDENGHGTHVAGTIAQATDNGIGCAGIAPAARILSVKALNAKGQGTNFTIAAGIRYAVDQGCQVVNLSLGGSPSRTLQDAVRYAHGRGVLLVAAAGNSGNAALTYPARYPETLSVGAVDSAGRKCNFSQYGSGLSIAAPGEDILQQTFRAGRVGYYYFSGTSMATPHVSGVAALVKSLRPNLSLHELRKTITDTATDLGPRGYDTQYGMGLVNAAAALERVGGGVPVPTEPGLPTLPTPGTPGAPTPTPQPGPGPGEDETTAEVLRHFNMERSRAGLSTIVMHPQLNTAAAVHAADMRRRNTMSHTGGDGSNPGQRMTRAGYPWRTFGEIVAMGQPTPASVVTAWMRSTGHRNIILGSQFSEVGIAKDGAYWAAVWGRR